MQTWASGYGLTRGNMTNKLWKGDKNMGKWHNGRKPENANSNEVWVATGRIRLPRWREHGGGDRRNLAGGSPENGPEVGLSSPEVMASLGANVAMMTIGTSLKSMDMEGVSNLGNHLGRRWLARARNTSQGRGNILIQRTTCCHRQRLWRNQWWWWAWIDSL